MIASLEGPRKDLALILAAKASRTFCYGYLGVFLPLHLERLSFHAGSVGWGVSLTLLASALATAAVRGPARRFGPRAVLIALSAGIAASGAILLASNDPWLIMAAAMLGNLAVGTGETGPFLSMEQVLLARRTSAECMTSLFSVYNLVGLVSSALGGLLVVKTSDPRLLFSGFMAAGLLQAALYASLEPSQADPSGVRARVEGRSGPLVRKMAVLFSLDSFAGGFLLRSLILFWLHRRFGLGLAELGWISFATQVVAGASYLLAAPLSRRMGLVNAMVFTHLIANVILIVVAFVPSAEAAVGLLLIRAVLSEIDVPARQSFMMLAVEDHERESAASITNTSRSLAQCLSPAATGWIAAVSTLSAPFVLGSGLKILYDLLLYAAVRDLAAGKAA